MATVPEHMEIIDTHTHVAITTDSRFPLSSSDLTPGWWNAGGTMEELLDQLDTNGVSRLVLVQAIGAYGYDCSYAATSAAAHPERAAFVAAVAMHNDDPVADLAALCEAPTNGALIAGVRLFGVDGRDPVWLSDGRAKEMWEFAAERDLVIVPTVFANRFDELRARCEERPEVPVAVDHCGFIDMVEGESEAMLFNLADTPSVHLKVTSYVLEAAERDEGDAAPLTERLLAAFGAERLCWGSDHPQDQRHDYAGKLGLASAATRFFDDEARAAFFGTTAQRLFFS